MNFSQRHGLEPTIKPFQTSSMDAALRNSIWNAYELSFLPHLRDEWEVSTFNDAETTRDRIAPIWVGFYKQSLTELSTQPRSALAKLSALFFDGAVTPWHKAYDFAEFLINLGLSLKGQAADFKKRCNTVFEAEFSPYRFVGEHIVLLTKEAEIKAVEKAAHVKGPLSHVGSHIDTALKHIANKKKPDYRNSIKESISAVEAICKIIAKNDKAILKNALDAIASKIKVHQRLQDGFKAIYDYTSDAHGIRHSMKDGNVPEQEDAIFMLVSCSAFVNYLVEKGRKHGLLS